MTHRQPSPSSVWATSGFRSPSNSASSIRRSASTCPTAKVDAYRQGLRPDRRSHAGSSSRRPSKLRVTTDAARLARGRFHRRRRADAGRRCAPARFRAAARRERVGRPEPEARRDRRVRIDRLPGRDRGNLRPGHRKAFRACAGSDDFFVGYSPERINPGDREHTLDRIIKVVSGDTPETLERVATVYGEHHHRRRASGEQHQGRGSGESHREHAARPQHRADERACADLPQDRHRHAWRCSKRRGPSGTSCRFGPAWSAGTASASIPTT